MLASLEREDGREMSTSVANAFARDIHDTFGTNSICPKMYSNRIDAYGFVDIAHTRVRTSRVLTDDWQVGFTRGAL